MTYEQLKLINEYMGWYWNPNVQRELPNRELDSNSAWECMQEIGRKEDGREFYYFIDDMICNKCYIYEYPSWIMNPTNFFNCMAVWLELKN